MLNICICQLIKDEQRYIEEWIDYYLNLGISKFVLFEDWNSSSHADILSKYGDKVILHKLYNIATQEEIESVQLVKKEIAWKCFYRLYKNKFDACLFIDPDEYIHCNKEEFINELNYFNDNTNATVIRYQWQCITASGYIKDPCPNKIYSIVNTYKTLYNDDNSELNNNFKCLLFLNKINEDIFMPIPHGPWIGDHIHYSQYKIYHYLTKSWEEFKWSLFIRGMQNKHMYNRKIEIFFDINKDLLPYKEQLLKECKGLKYKYNDYN